MKKSFKHIFEISAGLSFVVLLHLLSMYIFTANGFIKDYLEGSLLASIAIFVLSIVLIFFCLPYQPIDGGTKNGKKRNKNSTNLDNEMFLE